MVVPTRNRRDLLRRTLRSVLDQRDVDVSVVVVDEASSDGTAAYLADLVASDRPVRTVRHDRPAGVSRARNAGLELATTAWVAFVDDDDLWAPGKLAAQLDAVRADGEARWACVGCAIVDPGLEVIRASFTPRDRDVADHLLSFNHIPGGGSGVLADRVLVEDAGGFDVGLSTLADWDLWIRLGLRSPLAAVDRPLMAYLEHGGGMSRGARDIRSELEVIRTGYARERTERGQEFDRAWWLRWLGELDERSGRRGSALRHHAERLFVKDWAAVRDLGRALVGPRGWQRIDATEADQVPPDGRAEAEAWLAPLRSL